VTAADADPTLRVGVLTPHVAAGPEVEIPEIAPTGIEVSVARASRREGASAAYLRRLARPAALQAAVARLCAATVDVIAYASTTSGYAIGPAAEVELVERLRRMAGVPVVSSGIAVTQALETFGIRRVAVVHPPWFSDEMGPLGAEYFRARAFDVVMSTATSLPEHPDWVRPEHVIDWVTRNVDASTEAVFLAGNGLRAAQTIEALEHRTGQLVLAANQVLLWSTLAATGTTREIHHFGRLLRTDQNATRGRLPR
jgi:maleate isomerase